MRDLLVVLWAVAAWVSVSVLAGAAYDHPRKGSFMAGPNWRMLVWFPAYVRWNRAERDRLNERFEQGFRKLYSSVREPRDR
jgi:hypothetical protein